MIYPCPICKLLLIDKHNTQDNTHFYRCINQENHRIYFTVAHDIIISYSMDIDANNILCRIDANPEKTNFWLLHDLIYNEVNYPNSSPHLIHSVYIPPNINLLQPHIQRLNKLKVFL